MYITYIASGRLGDFLLQLSIIKEKYDETGKKGKLYLSNKAAEEFRNPIEVQFRNPIEDVYKDTFDIVMRQEYILDYKLHNNEAFDINLSSWRHSPFLFQQNFHKTYSSTYKVNWGTNKWIVLPYESKWKNVILVNSVPYRFKNVLNYEIIRRKYPDCKLMFISIDPSHYEHFIQHTQETMEYYCPSSLMDTAIAINSCRLFIGIPSGLLCIAFSCHKESITTSCPNHLDDILNGNMEFLNTSYDYSMSNLL